MPDDNESNADARHHETEEERRRQRGDEEADEEHSPVPDQGANRSSEESKEETPDNAELDDTPSSLTVPDISLVEESEAESLDLVTTVPSIEQTSREVTIPELSPPGITLDAASVDAETEIPTIEVEGNDWQIPLVQLESASSIKFQPSSFDAEIRDPPKRTRQQLTVPLYRRVSPPRIRFVPTLDEAVDDEIRRRLDRRESDNGERVDIQETGAADDEMEETAASGVETTTGGTVAPGGGDPTGSFDEVVPTFQDIIYSSGGGTTTSEGTTVVLFNEAEENSYVGSYLTLCRRIHREANGGHPEFQPINDLDEINKREIEKWLEAEKKVIFINLDNRERRIDEAKLREQLEATLGKFGFIVFKATDSDLVEEYRDILNAIRSESPHPPLNVVEVAPRQPGFETERRIAELCWGNLDLASADLTLDVPEIERPTGPGVFDDLFNRYALTRFGNYLSEIKSEERELFKRFTTQNGGQIQDKKRDDSERGESRLHYDLKVYVVRYLVNRLRDRGEEIDGLEDIEAFVETESERGGVIPDVFFSGHQQQEAYEVETLFGAGHEPTKKLDRTIEKYDEKGGEIDKVHIILENLTFLRHLDELSNMQYHYANRENDEGEPRIEFETLNLQTGGLLSLTTVIEEVKSATGLHPSTEAKEH